MDQTRRRWLFLLRQEAFVTWTGTKLRRKGAERASGTDVAAATIPGADVALANGEASPSAESVWNKRVAFGRCVKRIANLFATPFAGEPCSCQELKEVSAEAHPFVHAIWHGALLLVDPIVGKPLPVAPCSALRRRRQRVSVNRALWCRRFPLRPAPQHSCHSH
jgi:hypothetical protein